MGGAAVERVVNDPELACGGNPVGVLHDHGHTHRLLRLVGTEGEQIGTQQTFGIHTTSVNLVDLIDHGGGQVIQSVHRWGQDRVPKRHHATDLAGADAGHGFGVGVSVDDKFKLVAVDARLRHADGPDIRLGHQNPLVQGVTHTDQHGAVGFEFGLDRNQPREVAQQTIALIEQLRGLVARAAVLDHLLVEQTQLLGQGVDLFHIGFHRLACFVVQQFELTGQLPKTCGQAIGIAQEGAARDDRGRVAGQVSGRFKKQVDGGGQAHAFIAHDIDEPIDVRQQGLLAGQFAVAVAQVGFDEGVVLTLHVVESGAGAQVAAAHQTRLVGRQRHVLTGVALGADVGNVVGDGGQGALVCTDARAANAEQVTHGLSPILKPFWR